MFFRAGVLFPPEIIVKGMLFQGNLKIEGRLEKSL